MRKIMNKKNIKPSVELMGQGLQISKLTSLNSDLRSYCIAMDKTRWCF